MLRYEKLNKSAHTNTGGFNAKSNPLKNGIWKKKKINIETVIITEQTNNQKACTSKRLNRFCVIFKREREREATQQLSTTIKYQHHRQINDGKADLYREYKRETKP